ncbi:MAG TPA: flotillin family protein, partial [Phormidium sp.]
MTNFNFSRKFLPFATSLLVAGITAVAIPQSGSAESKIASTNPYQSSTQQSQSSDIQLVRADLGFSLPIWVYAVGGVVIILIFLPKIGWILGLIVIGEREVGIVTKKFAAKSLPPGKLIALKNEAGLQADTLPPGWHFGYFPWQYSIRKEPVIVIPQDEIGLIVANDGATIPSNRILGKVVECEDFQNARNFLIKGGEKGRQLAVITTGTYRINTALFEVITS